MKKNLLAFVILFLGTARLSAQGVELKWSDKFQYDNKIDGFFDSFLGFNNKFIYAKFTSLGNKKKLKLLAFDKTTMKKAGDIGLLGFSLDKSKEDMLYYRSIILENVIYVVWTKKKDAVVEIYAESFDKNLKRINGLKKIYEINASKKATDNLIILYNGKIGNKILLGKEFADVKEGDKLKMEFKLINEDFSMVNSDQVVLPIVIVKKARRDNSFSNTECSYEFGNDGFLYAKDVVKVSDDEKKNMKKGEPTVYSMLMQINLESGDVKSYSAKYPRKSTSNFSWVVTKNDIKLYGFFSDLDKDPKGNDTHGILFVSMDNKSFVASAPKFSYFDKSFLDQLYSKDKEDQKKGSGVFKSKKDKKSDEESIDNNYVIESTIDDGNSIILFCSMMNNWSKTVCSSSSNGGQTCRTYYYCTKNNVTAFKLSNTGDLMWAKNLDRSITYNSWYVYDLRVVKSGNNYYAIYGSNFQMNAEKKNRRSSKSRDQIKDRLEYAVFEGSNGNFKKLEYQVNKLGAKKEDKKFVAPTEITVLDNKFYVNSTAYKVKPSYWLGCFCFPLLLSKSFQGNHRAGTGYVGSINTLN